MTAIIEQVYGPDCLDMLFEPCHIFIFHYLHLSRDIVNADLLWLSVAGIKSFFPNHRNELLLKANSISDIKQLCLSCYTEM